MGTKKKLLKEVNGRCFYCGAKLFADNLTFDHIIPKSKGGNGRKANLCACCWACNGLKREFSVEELRRIMIIALEVEKYNFYFERIGLNKLGDKYAI